MDKRLAPPEERQLPYRRPMDPLELLRELVSIPGPPGQEEAVAQAVAGHARNLGYSPESDAKGNLIIRRGDGPPKVVVTAHLDEIAMIVRYMEPDGHLVLTALGGLFPWKLGEGPVLVMGASSPVNGILSFGSIHTTDLRNSARAAVTSALDWDMCRVITGRSQDELARLGVRPGTRVVVAPERRHLFPVGDLVGSYFLDDRADLVSMILALELLQDFQGEFMFAATASEEVGGEGALFLLQKYRPDICIALELGPNVEDAPVELTDEPTLWVNDSYSTMAASDIDLVTGLGRELGLDLQLQALSRGGSDASCAASHGLCGRPFTLGLPMANSHGFEIFHPASMGQLAKLTDRLVRSLVSGG